MFDMFISLVEDLSDSFLNLVNISSEWLDVLDKFEDENTNNQIPEELLTLEDNAPIVLMIS